MTPLWYFRAKPFVFQNYQTMSRNRCHPVQRKFAPRRSQSSVKPEHSQRFYFRRQSSPFQIHFMPAVELIAFVVPRIFLGLGFAAGVGRSYK